MAVAAAAAAAALRMPPRRQPSPPLARGSALAGLRLRPPAAASRPQRGVLAAAASDGNGDGSLVPFDPSSGGGGADDTMTVNNFCIIEGRDTVQDFAKMQLQEIKDAINTRRNRIFLLMEEVRRLRIQKRAKSKEQGLEEEAQGEEQLEYPSNIPFLPPLTPSTLQQYWVTFFSLVIAIIVFGGFLAPTLELKLGLGGTSYEDFILSLHLPVQLSQVDPIVASFSGGAVGVLSTLMVVEANNVNQQEHKKCRYCLGTGYLACARCSGTGFLPTVEALAETSGSSSTANGPLTHPRLQRCVTCSGAAKLMHQLMILWQAGHVSHLLVHGENTCYGA
eukprot:SM000334S12544  [mRNA]  locus=s334:631:2808:- [translate_table: standard]